MGDLFGGRSRVDDDEPGYCEVLREVTVALRWARAASGGWWIVAIGSRFTAALVMWAARGDDPPLYPVAAFSPAEGEPMGMCQPSRAAADIKVPTLVVRPSGELEAESAMRQVEPFRWAGIPVIVVAEGVHVSSTLDPLRHRGDPEGEWAAPEHLIAGP